MDAGNDSILLIKNHIDSINSASIAYKLNLMAEYPESMLTLLFNTMKDPEIPDFFLADGRQDTLGAYLYFRKHYWDNIELSDERLLRTPVFHRKLEQYMTEIIPKHPDSIILEIEAMITNTGTNTEMRDYLLWYFTSTYETSNIMGYDEIFVYMVDNYFTTYSYDWLYPVVQENMIKRANQMRGLLIDETAPLLLLADTNSQYINILEVKAEYLIIIFWSSTCGECQREVKTLNDFYTNTDLDVKIYAVNADTTLSKWKNYIKQHHLDWIHVNGNYSLSGDYHVTYDIYSTPVIYILDEDKRIIAKRLAAEKIPSYIRRYKKLKTK
jgi:peroxiredoxin